MIRILSDLHCGHRASLIRNFDQIEPLLEGARTIVFNGDTVEFRLSEGRERGQELLEELGRFCCDRDVEAIFLNGNHDPDASERNFLKLLGGKVLVTHGDLFFEAISPWSRGAKRLRKNHEKLFRKISPGNLEERLEVVRRVCVESYSEKVLRPRTVLGWIGSVLEEFGHPGRGLEILRAWRNGPALAADFAAKVCPEVRCVIMGHTHLPGHRFRDGTLVVNTGAFLPFFGRRAVDVSERAVFVRKIERKGKRFYPGRFLFQWSPEEVDRSVSLELPGRKVQKEY